MEEQKWKEDDSLRLIQQMIQSAKEEHNDRGDAWLMWGWLLFIASAGSLVCYYAGWRNYIGWIWTAVLGVGMVVYIIMRARHSSKGVKTYASELLGKISNGFFISLFVLVGAAFIIESMYTFGYYYILYAFWMFIYGSALRFRPFIIGAVINWVCALLIFYFNEVQYTMMISVIAVVAGYLVPGYLLRRQYLHQHPKEVL
jgi:hypothetical protein